MKEGEIGNHYGRVSFSSGPKIYSSGEFYDLIFELGGFSQSSSYRILDAMCGSGLVGKEVSKRLDVAGIEHSGFYLDLAENHLRNLSNDGEKTVLASAEHLPFSEKNFDTLYARFGVKNYPKINQIDIMREFGRILSEDGNFILVDLEAPHEAYEFMQIERRKKHEYSNLQAVDQPHIPTGQLWVEMLKLAGFNPNKIERIVSEVATTDWVSSGQMPAENLPKMNSFLLEAPEYVKRAMNIREENGLVRIDYPIILISSSKTE